jgi:hypothetical protein
MEHAWRGSHPQRDFSVGPQFQILNGELQVGGKKLLEVPLNQWVRYRLSAKLGKLDPGIGKAGAVDHGLWELTVTLPDGSVREFKRLAAADEEFSDLNAVMFISLAQEATTFYLDSVHIRQE